MLLSVCFLVSACKDKNQVQSENVLQSSEKEALVQEIDSEGFLLKVLDISNYSQTRTLKKKSDKPCLVDFSATWCGPCRKQAPILERLAEKYAGLVNIYKIDVDASPDIANFFGVQSIPFLLFIPAKGNIKSKSGLTSFDELDEMLSESVVSDTI